MWTFLSLYDNFNSLNILKSRKKLFKNLNKSVMEFVIVYGVDSLKSSQSPENHNLPKWLYKWVCYPAEFESSTLSIVKSIYQYQVWWRKIAEFIVGTK